MFLRHQEDYTYGNEAQLIDLRLIVSRSSSSTTTKKKFSTRASRIDNQPSKVSKITQGIEVTQINNRINIDITLKHKETLTLYNNQAASSASHIDNSTDFRTLNEVSLYSRLALPNLDIHRIPSNHSSLIRPLYFKKKFPSHTSLITYWTNCPVKANSTASINLTSAMQTDQEVEFGRETRNSSSV